MAQKTVSYLPKMAERWRVEFRVRATEDFQEGPRAFVEKRPQRWTGR